MSLQLLWRSVRRRWLGYAVALVAVAPVSGFIGLVLRQVNLANVSMQHQVEGASGPTYTTS